MIEIRNIRQLLPLVEKKPEFVVIQKDGYQVIDYVFQQEDTFDQPELMECRGIKFDENGLILARPFRKFFNYGEQGSPLPLHKPHVKTVKLDGSMIHPVMLGRKMYFMTRKGHTDVARKAERFVLSNPNRNYSGFCRALIEDGYTPIFEYIGPDNRIVLRYEEPSLVVLAARHMIDGSLLSREDLTFLAHYHGVPFVDEVLFPETDVDAFVAHARELEEAEGYVVYFDNGYMVKIKAEDYVLKHRALDDLSSKKKIVALCCQGFTDDVLPILSEEDQRELLDFNRELQAQVTKYAEFAEGLASNVLDGTQTRKEFALTEHKFQPQWLKGIAFGVMDGKDARALVLKHLEKNPEAVPIQWRGE